MTFPALHVVLKHGDGGVINFGGSMWMYTSYTGGWMCTSGRSGRMFISGSGGSSGVAVKLVSVEIAFTSVVFLMGVGAVMFNTRTVVEFFTETAVLLTVTLLGFAAVVVLAGLETVTLVEVVVAEAVPFTKVFV
jgi:hypothetical protein